MKQMFIISEKNSSEVEFVGTEQEFLTVDKFYAKIWKLNGKIHRDEDSPAIILSDGSQFWYQNGGYHRGGDSPAITTPNGYRAWYKNGQPHRIGGYARIFSNGDKSWYKNGKLHRIDGPAMIWGGKYNDVRSYYIEGKNFDTEEEFNKARASYSVETDNPILEFLRDEFDIISSDDGFEKLKQIKKVLIEFENIKKCFQD